MAHATCCIKVSVTEIPENDVINLSWLFQWSKTCVAAPTLFLWSILECYQYSLWRCLKCVNLVNLKLNDIVYITRAHVDVINWKRFPRYWPFVRGIHRSPVNSPAQRPVTRSFDVFFDLRTNKRLSKQWWDWWFETPSCPLGRHCSERLAFNTPLKCLDLHGVDTACMVCEFLDLI